MRLLFVIPHFCGSSPTQAKYGSQSGQRAERGLALRRCVMSLHQTLGSSQAIIQVGSRTTMPANQSLKHQVQVCIVTNSSDHALDQAALPQAFYERVTVDVPPMSLGFACHRLLKERMNDFEYFGYLEDDLILHDAWFLEKLIWFNRHLGNDNLLLPNRFECSVDLAYHKCYLDGDLKPHVCQSFHTTSEVPGLSSELLGHKIEFERPLNPHSGCFFLNPVQLEHWSKQDDFGLPRQDFIGPLESAASLGVMRSFRVYKPSRTNASFLEIEHSGDNFIRKIHKA